MFYIILGVIFILGIIKILRTNFKGPYMITSYIISEDKDEPHSGETVKLGD